MKYKKLGIICCILVIAITGRIFWVNFNVEPRTVFKAGDRVTVGKIWIQIDGAYFAKEKDREMFAKEINRIWKDKWKDFLPGGWDIQNDPLIVLEAETTDKTQRDHLSVIYKKGLSEQISRVYHMPGIKMGGDQYKLFFPLDKDFLKFPGNTYVMDLTRIYNKQGEKKEGIIEFEVKNEKAS